MTNAGFNPRGGFSQRNHSRHRPDTNNGGGGRFKDIEGMFDHFHPTEAYVWVSLCPTQSYTYLWYDRATKEIQEYTTEYFRFLEHFVGANKNRFNCSSGPYMMEPCYGCSERTAFYQWKDEQRAVTGTDTKEMPPIGRSERNVLSITVVDPVFELQKLDDEGKPRKRKNGSSITTFMPRGHYMQLPKEKKLPKIGERPMHRFHWMFGPDALDALIGAQTMLECYCANCAKGLGASAAYCPACGDVNDAWFEMHPEGLHSGEMEEDRAITWDCPKCGHSGFDDNGIATPLIYDLTCDTEGCTPEAGNLFAFELQLGAIMLDEQKVPHVKALRPRGDYSNVEGAEEMLFKPLDIAEIFAPTKLTEQVKKLPENRKKLAKDNLHIDANKNKGETESLGKGEKQSVVF